MSDIHAIVMNKCQSSGGREDVLEEYMRGGRSGARSELVMMRMKSLQENDRLAGKTKVDKDAARERVSGGGKPRLF
jgi:hypothetical protein